jgi:hypothetical protein
MIPVGICYSYVVATDEKIAAEVDQHPREVIIGGYSLLEDHPCNRPWRPIGL